MSVVLPVTQVRKDFLKLIDKIDKEYTRVDIAKRGRVKASLVSSDYLDELEETIYSLTYSLKDIRKAEKEIAQGKYVTLKELKKDFVKRQKLHAR